jgi:hypothetical protein
MHADVNNAPVAEAMLFVGGPLDHALSAFIEDVQARGLEEKILLVATGELGRTPRVNQNGGRDHWGNLTPLLFYGGGLRMGQVIGRSSRDGGLHFARRIGPPSGPPPVRRQVQQPPPAPPQPSKKASVPMVLSRLKVASEYSNIRPQNVPVLAAISVANLLIKRAVFPSQMQPTSQPMNPGPAAPNAASGIQPPPAQPLVSPGPPQGGSQQQVQQPPPAPPQQQPPPPPPGAFKPSVIGAVPPTQPSPLLPEYEAINKSLGVPTAPPLSKSGNAKTGRPPLLDLIPERSARDKLGAAMASGRTSVPANIIHAAVKVAQPMTYQGMLPGSMQMPGMPPPPMFGQSLRDLPSAKMPAIRCHNTRSMPSSRSCHTPAYGMPMTPGQGQPQQQDPNENAFGPQPAARYLVWF